MSIDNDYVFVGCLLTKKDERRLKRVCKEQKIPEASLIREMILNAIEDHDDIEMIIKDKLMEGETKTLDELKQ